LGFIDGKRKGSGLQGDYTVFVISERWKAFGTPQFVVKEFPQSMAYGYRERKQKQRTEANVGQRVKLLLRKR
jgi:hypothetical protein